MDMQRGWAGLSYPERVAAVISTARGQGAGITEDQARHAVETDELIRSLGPGWEDMPIPYEVTEAGRRALASGGGDQTDAA